MGSKGIPRRPSQPYFSVLVGIQALCKLTCEKCSDCCEILTAQEKIPVKDHNYNEDEPKALKLLDELLICKQQIKILKKALPYYNIKVLCNAGRITEEELEVLLKYEVLVDDK